MTRHVALRSNITGYKRAKHRGGLVVERYRRSLREMILIRQTLLLEHGMTGQRCLWRNGHQRGLMGHYSTLLSRQAPVNGRNSKPLPACHLTSEKAAGLAE